MSKTGWAPDFGPSAPHPSAGATVVGARMPLIAFNVDLEGDDVEAAREVARAVRERDGGFPGVRALGLRLPRGGRVQVSLNIEDWRASPLHEVVATVQGLAQGGKGGGGRPHFLAQGAPQAGVVNGDDGAQAGGAAKQQQEPSQRFGRAGEDDVRSGCAHEPPERAHGGEFAVGLDEPREAGLAELQRKDLGERRLSVRMNQDLWLLK